MGEISFSGMAQPKRKHQVFWRLSREEHFLSYQHHFYQRSPPCSICHLLSTSSHQSWSQQCLRSFVLAMANLFDDKRMLNAPSVVVRNCCQLLWRAFQYSGNVESTGTQQPIRSRLTRKSAVDNSNINFLH
jgi:hypothetical protein